MRTLAFVTGAVLVLGALPARAQEFTYDPPGQLVPDSGMGRVDETVYFPGLLFPMETGPAFANSQVWGVGGLYGPAGSQCDEANFSYPWHDNYCEERQWDMPLCPSGIGHQGQDIRAATCEKLVHWVVAGADGTVTHIGSYTVYITTADGTRLDYLHMGNVQVQEGDEVKRGDRIGQVSNEFGGEATSVHLHFNIQQNVSGVGTVFVPPYMSLVKAYEALVGPPVAAAVGGLDAAACDGITGWAASPAEPDLTIEAKLFFDDAPGGVGAVGHPVLADEAHDVCGTMGACSHGFFAYPPVSLLDGKAHAVHGTAVSGRPVPEPLLDGAPQSFTCSLDVGRGTARFVSDAALEAWRLSTFWDERGVGAGVIDALDRGNALPERPRYVASQSAPGTVYFVEGSTKRAFANLRSQRAWHVSPLDVERVGDSVLAGLADGPVMPVRPVVLRGPDGSRVLYEASASPPIGTGGASATGGAGGGVGTESDAGCDCVVGTASGSSPSRWLVLALGIVAIRSRGRLRRP